MAAKKPVKRVKAGTSKASAAERKALFVEAYISNDGNGKQAAIAAGCPPKGAAVSASRMLKDANVSAEIERRRAEVIEKAKKKTQLTADEVMESLARDLRFDPAKLFKDDGSMKKITELDEDTRLALRAIDFDEIRVGGETIGQTAKIKFPEKTSVREQGMKHFGLYKADNKQKGESLALLVAFGREQE